MKKISKIATLVGTLVLSTMFFNTASADTNPFAQQAAPVQTIIGDDGKCGESKDKKDGKCGDKAKKDGKCGEKGKKDGKCGEKGKKEGKCGEGKCGEGKKGKKDGKCGGLEDKKDAKCGDSKGKKDKKCGEGKCGGK
jgi:uncharacterized low-complexity protein